MVKGGGRLTEQRVDSWRTKISNYKSWSGKQSPLEESRLTNIGAQLPS